MTLSTQRKFISPQPGDTIETIAARELPEMDSQEAVASLTSWNLHIFLMRQPNGMITGSDVVFVEPPLVQGNMTMMPDAEAAHRDG
ncbi:MAG: hypothetical protein AAF541_03295 [Pseudomonadota bacterium]